MTTTGRPTTHESQAGYANATTERVAAANGWAGLVINGCVRDVAVLRHLPRGIKAIGACPRPSGKEGAGEVDVPVELGGITIQPGARLASDDDGIVVLG